LKRWEDEGRQAADLPALEWCMANGIRTIEIRLGEVLANMPNRLVAVFLKLLIQPLGANPHGPSDDVVHRCAQLILAPSAARDRLTANLSHVDDDGGLSRLEKAFALVIANEELEKRMRAAHIHDWSEAVTKGVITQAEGERVKAAHEAVSRAIEVDDFAPEALSSIYRKPSGAHSSPERAAS
jgi:acyl-CoA dehydrogenase